MISVWLLTVAVAHECEDVSLDELAAISGPAVLVLGERHGSKPDMKRAHRLVKALVARGPVQLGMEAVHESNQAVLDAYANGEVRSGKLSSALQWEETWGYAWQPYKKLVFSGRKGVRVRAAGLDLGPKPDDRDVELPDGYREVLMASLGAHGEEMPEHIKERFPTSMAWRDFRIAELSAEGWSGEGYLVVLTGRGHVEGGRGTNWQLAKLVDAPVHSVVLAHEGARCEAGDRLWKD